MTGFGPVDEVSPIQSAYLLALLLDWSRVVVHIHIHARFSRFRSEVVLGGFGCPSLQEG